MFLVKTEGCFFWMVLCYTSVASTGNTHYHDSCNTSTLQAPLGSSVLLPCSFGSTTSLGISPGHGWVVWNQGSGSGASLVNITSSGKVDFLNPRQGRVKAFPNQGGLGNFSIRIDALQALDLGFYFCELQSNDQCHRVEVEELDQDSTDLQVLFFSVSVVAVIIVLLSGCFCWVKWTRVSSERTPYSINTHFYSGSSAPPEDVACSDNVERDVAQERGAGNERPIYENNEHDPTRIQHDPTRIQHEPTRIQHDPTRIQHDPTRIQHGPPRNQHEPSRYQNKQVRDLSKRFHRELVSRLRQSSLGRHYYANQAEINQQARAQMDNHQRANEAETNQEGRSQMDNPQRGSFRKPKQKCEYKNPIYNNSTEQLNKL